jgi:serine/threonine protein phosphatase 1
MEKCMNQLTFAIGDIHGEMFLLHQLVKQCFAHAKAQETEAHFVFLGDYVDRGPRSNEVIAFLRKLPNATCLRGNHDHMMSEALIHKIRDSKYWWLNNGGLRTIESYAAPNYSPEMVMEYASILADAHWLASLPVSFEDGHRFFCHAGIRPGVPLAEQSDDDLMWIREEFTACHAMHPKLIVHGHTPCLSGPEVRPNRVGIDTGGCFKNGQLTAAVFDETQAEPINFISVER